MRNILLIGAGRSSTSLINYFLKQAQIENWILTVADFTKEIAVEKVNNHPAGVAVSFNVEDEIERRNLVSKSDIVISLLPPNMHLPIAKECLVQKKNLVTASYVTPEMQSLSDEAAANGIIFLNECGLDPGIDHMSAMEIIDQVKDNGGILTSFRSYTGGLVAPESNDNPWGYKFSWNPRNVILAGQGTARFIEDGNYKYVPYSRLFANNENITIEGHGNFDGYANRDSLSYRKIYGLENIKTLIRGTLRQSGFCHAWNVFVQLGLTDDSYMIEDSQHLTYKKLVEAFLPSNVSGKSIEEKLVKFTGLASDSTEMKLILWTGILADEIIGLENASPAMILQNLLEPKWKLKDSDKDMIVMQHLFEYILDGKKVKRTSSLVVKGDDPVHTAMAKTVGLPAAIAATQILNGKISLKGVVIPVHKQIYEPVLRELKLLGISFADRQTEIV